MPTERECVLRERKAYAAGRGDSLIGWQADMESKYPLPKVTRPRVVRDDRGVSWRAVDGALQVREMGCGTWWATHSMVFDVTPRRVVLWADLLKNPTETVEDTGDGSSHPSDQ